MATSMRERFLWICHMGKVPIIGLTVTNTLGISRQECAQGTAPFIGQQGVGMKENLSTVFEMVTGYITMPMVIDMKVVLNKGKEMVGENITMWTERNWRVISPMAH